MSQGRGSPGGAGDVLAMSAAGATGRQRLTFAGNFAFSCAQLGSLAVEGVADLLGVDRQRRRDDAPAVEDGRDATRHPGLPGGSLASGRARLGAQRDFHGAWLSFGPTRLIARVSQMPAAGWSASF